MLILDFDLSKTQTHFFRIELCKVYFSQWFWAREARTYDVIGICKCGHGEFAARSWETNRSLFCSYRGSYGKLKRDFEIRLIWCQFFNLKDKWGRYFIRNGNWNFLDVFTTDSLAGTRTFTHHLMSECFVWNWIIGFITFPNNNNL